MSPDDPAAPPHELRGVLGSASDGDVPRAPGPSLAQSSPGLATAALAPPPGAPTVPEADPDALALVLQRMAGELLGGASVVPVPSPNDALTAPGVVAPASPGIPPQLVPDVPDARVPPLAGPASVPSSGDLGAGLVAPQLAVPQLAVPQLAGPASVPGSGDLGAGLLAPVAGLPAGTVDALALAPTLDRGAAAAPHTGGTGAFLSPPSPAAPAAFDAPISGAELDRLARLAEGQHVPAGSRVPLAEPSGGDVPYWWPPAATGPAGELAEPREAGERAPAAITESDPPRDSRARAGEPFDPYLVRRDFPILEERVHGGKRVVWLDNAATTQKPRAVIDRLTYYYEHENSNVHRAAHALAARATDAFESARETTRRFLNAPSANEIVFVRGATEGINLIAKTWGARNLEPSDEIVLTHLEHHANIVPWQQLAAARGARLKVAPVDDRGDVVLEDYERLFTSRTKLVAFTQVSNALGTVTPAREMIEIAHRRGAIVLLDGAQAVSHMAVDVQQLDCDFYVFSGHKVFAPTGIGAVFGKRALLEAMPPWQGGGNMIQDVTFERTTYQPPPGRFEAGTGNIADAAGLGAALDYVMRLGLDVIERYEHELLGYATARLHEVPGLTMIGTPVHKAGVLSFVLDGQRTEDVGAALDKDGIAVRSGHHCAQPILRRYGLESTVRASLAFYNVREDIDELVAALQRLQASV